VRAVDVKRKLDSLAENMKKLQIKETTHIDWNCLTCEERVLFEKVNEIREEYGCLPPDAVLKENDALFSKAFELIMRRVVDLFQEATKAICMVSTRDEAFFDLVFTMRILWFIHEMRRHAEQNRKEEELYDRYKRSEDFEKAWKEYKDKREDKTTLWSPESFERFIQPAFGGMRRKRGN
jgi:hypothetical protein